MPMIYQYTKLYAKLEKYVLKAESLFREQVAYVLS